MAFWDDKNERFLRLTFGENHVAHNIYLNSFNNINFGWLHLATEYYQDNRVSGKITVDEKWNVSR